MSTLLIMLLVWLLIIPVFAVMLLTFRPTCVRVVRQWTLPLICAAGPLALSLPWVDTPGFPGAFGGYSFFLHWLTKHPNFGPINIEVFLGINCMVATCCLPPIFALLHMRGMLRRSLLVLGPALALPCYIAVVIHLESGLLEVGIKFKVYFLVLGPLVRASAIGAMVLIAIRGLRRPNVRRDESIAEESVAAPSAP